MTTLHPRHHYYILAIATVAAAWSMVAAAAPYLYADSELPPPPPDTVLTAPLPQDPTPTLSPNQPGALNEQTMIQSTLPCITTSKDDVKPCPPNGTAPQPGSPNNSSGYNTADMKHLIQLLHTQKSGDTFTAGTNTQTAPATTTPNISPLTKDLSSIIRKLNRSGCSIDTTNLKTFVAPTTTTDNTTSDQTTNTHQLSNQINIARQMCDLRQRLKNLDQQLTKLETIVKDPTSFDGLGIDTTVLTQKVQDMRTAFNAAQDKLNAGTPADLADLKTYFDSLKSGEPQDVARVIQGLKQLNQLLKIVKNKDALAQINADLAPVLSDMNDGKYADARMALDKIFASLVSLTKAQLKLQRLHFGKEQPILDQLKALGKKVGAKPHADNQGRDQTSGITGTSPASPSGNDNQQTPPPPPDNSAPTNQPSDQNTPPSDQQQPTQ